MTYLPVARTLTPEALRAGAADLLPGLAAEAAAVAPLPDGVRLTFASAPGVAARIARAVDREQECCRFLSFALTVPAGGAPVELAVTGPPGTRELLAGLGPALATA